MEFSVKLEARTRLQAFNACSFRPESDRGSPSVLCLPLCSASLYALPLLLSPRHAICTGAGDSYRLRSWQWARKWLLTMHRRTVTTGKAWLSADQFKPKAGSSLQNPAARKLLGTLRTKGQKAGAGRAHPQKYNGGSVLRMKPVQLGGQKTLRSFPVGT